MRKHTHTQREPNKNVVYCENLSFIFVVVTNLCFFRFEIL